MGANFMEVKNALEDKGAKPVRRVEVVRAPIWSDARSGADRAQATTGISTASGSAGHGQNEEPVWTRPDEESTVRWDRKA